MGITKQEQKVSSTASIGVLGEILAGLYLQAGISPFITVRCILRWPDFIVSIGNRRFAFVESKAFAGDPGNGSGIAGRVQSALLKEAVIDAVLQLNSNPFVSVWSSFTHLESVNPLRVRLSFLELLASDDVKRATGPAKTPPEVIDGLARRAVELAADIETRNDGYRQPILDKAQRAASRRDIQELAVHELEELLEETHEGTTKGDDSAGLTDDLDDYRQAISRYARAISTARVAMGKNLTDLKMRYTEGELKRLRLVGKSALFMTDISKIDRGNRREWWQADWDQVNKPWKTVGAAQLWRCGGVVLCLAADELEGTRVDRRSN